MNTMQMNETTLGWNYKMEDHNKCCNIFNKLSFLSLHTQSLEKFGPETSFVYLA